jgi:HemK-like putative methylase
MTVREQVRLLQQHLSRKQASRAVNDLVKRKKPVAYILGTQPFAGLSISCQSPVLIPRAETEHWVLKLIRHMMPWRECPLRVLDVGTGTGCIAAALARRYPRWHITALDVDPRAGSLARHNCRHLPNVVVVEGDVFSDEFANTSSSSSLSCSSASPPSYDLIVSNPPYVPPSEAYTQVTTSVRAWESPKAVFSSTTTTSGSEDEEGTRFHQRLLQLAPTLLRGSVTAKSASPNLVMECHSRPRHMAKLHSLLHSFKHRFQRDQLGRWRVLHVWI